MNEKIHIGIHIIDPIYAFSENLRLVDLEFFGVLGKPHLLIDLSKFFIFLFFKEYMMNEL